MNDYEKALFVLRDGPGDVPSRTAVADAIEALHDLLTEKPPVDRIRIQLNSLREHAMRTDGPGFATTVTFGHLIGTLEAILDRSGSGRAAVADDDWDDKPLPEDDAIKAVFPTRSGRHDLYAEAMRLVGAKRSKRALVELVNWLLHREADECLEVEAARVLLKQWQDGRGDADDTSAYLKHRIIKGVR